MTLIYVLFAITFNLHQRRALFISCEWCDDAMKKELFIYFQDINATRQLEITKNYKSL